MFIRGLLGSASLGTLASAVCLAPLDDSGADFVSDLNEGTADDTISVHDGDVNAHGADAVGLNEGTRPKTSQPKKVGSDEPANTQKPLSLRDQISSALKGEPETPPAAQQDGRPRNPDGTFAPKAAEAAPDGQQQQGQQPAAASTPPPAGIDPQVFASLPAETQAQLARTMEDVSNQQKRFATLEPLEQIIAPRFEAWALNGMSPAQAVHQLLALSDYATRDPTGFIKYFAQHNGVDLEQVVLGMEPEEPLDPHVAEMQKELNRLRGIVEGQTTQQQQAAHNAMVETIVQFASEKDGEGKALRPYFDELGDAVLPYISMVRSQNPNWSPQQVLQEAYDRACWATPGVRKKLQEAATAAAEAARLREQAERNANRRNASVSVPSGTPSSPPVAPNDSSRSLRDIIKASINAHS